MSLFKTPFKLVTRHSLKHNAYTKLRQEVQDTFPSLSDEDIDVLLPIKSKIFEDKLSNDAICYGFVSDEPLFFRQKSDTPPPKGKGKKSDTSSDDLIPTIFAIWKIPHILPPVYTNSKVFPKITGIRSTALYLPGLICPDLPDIFYLKGSKHPLSFHELFPNTTISDDPSSAGTYPPYFYKNSFDYLLQPNELRAMYVIGNPYCIGVCRVPSTFRPQTILPYARTSGSTARYISPWSKQDWITDHIGYSDQQDQPRFKWPIVKNPYRPSPELSSTATTDDDGTKSPSSNKPDGQSLANDKDNALVVTSPEDEEPSSCSTDDKDDNANVNMVSIPAPNHLTSNEEYTTLYSMIELFARLLSISTDPSAAPMLLMLRSIVADQVFQPLLHATSIPIVGYAAGHKHAPSIDYLLRTHTILDTRPIGTGVGLTVIHSLNDTLSSVAPHRYPTDAFTFTSANQCMPKLHNECAFQWRRVFLILRIAYLSCVCLPLIPSTLLKSTTIPSRFDLSVGNAQLLLPQPQKAQPSGVTAPSNQFPLDFDPTIIEPDFIVVQERGDDDDDDHIDEDEEDDTICDACYQARLDWALQYVVNSPNTDFPAQFSQINTQIRLCSACPNGLKYIHTPAFRQEKIGPLCECDGCSGMNYDDNRRNTIERCQCVNIIVDLRVNESKYQKMNNLVKKAEKQGWIYTKTVSGQPTIAGNGSLSAKITETDRRAVDDYAERRKAGTLPPTGIAKSDQSALINVIHMVQFSHAMSLFLTNYCPSYTMLSTFLEEKLKSPELSQQQMQLGDILGMFQRKCHTLKIGDAHRITTAILTYIKEHHLEVVVKDGVVVKSQISDDRLPPVIKQSMVITPAKSSRHVDHDGDDDCDDDESDSLSTPSDKNRSHSSRLRGQWGDQSGIDGIRANKGELSDSDDDMPPLSPYGHDGHGEDDSLNDDLIDNSWDNRKHGSKKGNAKTYGSRSQMRLNTHPSPSDKKGHNQGDNRHGQTLQRPSTKVKQKSTHHIETSHQKQQKQQKPSVQKKEQQASPGLPRHGVHVYLAYDDALFKALNLQQNKSYTINELPILITKSLTPVYTTSNDIVYSLSLLSQTNDYATLVQQSKRGISPQQLQQALQRLSPDIVQAEAKLSSHFSGSMSHIQEAMLVISQLKFRSGAPPKVIIAAVQYRGNPLTLMCGLERYGIDPHRLANDSSLKQFMACSVSALDCEEHPNIRMLIPVTLDVHVKTMIQFQGDQSHRLTQYLVDKLGIEKENIQDIRPKNRKKK